jgi:hypothetical protein
VRLTQQTPDPATLSGEEQAILEKFRERQTSASSETLRQAWGKMHPKSGSGTRALFQSPLLAQALHDLGTAVMSREDTELGFTAADHQIVDLVLCFDAGHWCVVPFHTILAVAYGVSVDTIEALRDGRDDDLPADVLQLKEFIRDVRDGTVSDVSFDAMRSRFGSERGVIEYATMVMLLETHVRLAQLIDEHEITPEEFSDLLDELRADTWQPMPDPARAKAVRLAMG